MFKYIKYIKRAFALGTLLAFEVPKIMEDGKVTIDEIVDFAKQVFEIGGWKAHFEVPKELKNKSLDANIE
jgi:hypothetical protein